jgi:hypothetical protein
VALEDVYLPGADPTTPKTDEGERAMLGWIYFAEEVAPGRILLWEQALSKQKIHRKGYEHTSYQPTWSLHAVMTMLLLH